MSESVIHLEVVCPACGEVLDHGFRTSGPTSHPHPEPGDTFVCSECGIISVFITSTALRCATREEVAEIPPPELSKLRDAFLKYHGYQ